jgi:hypothetical protein
MHAAPAHSRSWQGYLHAAGLVQKQTEAAACWHTFLQTDAVSHIMAVISLVLPVTPYTSDTLCSRGTLYAWLLCTAALVAKCSILQSYQQRIL